MHSIKKKLATMPILRRSLWSALIVATYILGNHIYLPYVTHYQTASGALLYSGSTLGANYLTMTVFSLGLGPWMSSMIVWQLLVSIKSFKLDKIPQKWAGFYQMALTLIVAIVQAIALAAVYTSHDANWWHKAVITLVLVAGSFLLVWLASMNTVKGIGGSLLIILFGILASTTSELITFFTKHASHSLLGILLLLVILLAIRWGVLFERSEYRIPLVRIMILGDLKEKTYFPIKVNTGGLMAIMFGLSLTTLPTYLFTVLKQQGFANEFATWGLSHFSLTSFWGVSVYNILLGFLAYAFTYITVNPTGSAKNLRETGDYLEASRPGVPTRNLLRHYVHIFGLTSAAITIAIAGLPLYFNLVYPKYEQYFMLPGTFMMFAVILLQVFDYVDVLSIKRKYHDIY